MVSKSNYPPTSLESTGALLREVVRLHASAQRDSVACCGATVAGCHILTELGRTGPLPVTLLGRRLGLTKGWVSRAVDALARDKMVVRARAQGDGRVVLVALSSRGRQRLRSLNRALDDQAARVLRRLSEADRAQVHRALALVSDALHAEHDFPSAAQEAAPGSRRKRR